MNMFGARNPAPQEAIDSTFEAQYSIGDLAKQWLLGRETVPLLLTDEPGVVKIRLETKKPDPLQPAGISRPSCPLKGTAIQSVESMPLRFSDSMLLANERRIERNKLVHEPF
jgi:hypothetical protein